MKKIAIVLVMLCMSFGFSQSEQKPIIKKKGDLTEATYLYDNGNVQQIGTFNADGKLHGTWTSFDETGNKVAIGDYSNGKKVGKWFFWSDDSLKEVDYLNSKIVQVSEWKDKTKLAVRYK